MRPGQVIVRDPRLARGAVVLHRDANHRACAAGVIKCHTALSVLALTVNKPSPPANLDTNHSMAWATRGHSAPSWAHYRGTHPGCRNQIFSQLSLSFKDRFYLKCTTRDFTANGYTKITKIKKKMKNEA